MNYLSSACPNIELVYSINYFGRMLSVLFDEYLGVIIGQRVANGSLIEDGAEDKSVDPAVDDDYTLIK